MFGGLGGDFCKDTYEAKLFGMHMGSILSGLYAGNVNTDSKISIVGVWRRVRVEGSKMTIFRCLETLEDFCKRAYEPKLGCIVEVF